MKRATTTIINSTQTLLCYKFNSFFRTSVKRFYSQNLGFRPWIVSQQSNHAPAPLSIQDSSINGNGAMIVNEDRYKAKLPSDKQEWLLADKEAQDIFDHKLAVVHKINKERK